MKFKQRAAPLIINMIYSCTLKSMVVDEYGKRVKEDFRTKTAVTSSALNLYGLNSTIKMAVWGELNT